MSALKVLGLKQTSRLLNNLLLNTFSLVQRNTPSTTDKAQRITTKIARFIVKDMRPKRMVYSKEFREMMAECEPQYQVPSRKAFSDVIIPKMYAKVYDEVKTCLNHTEMVIKCLTPACFTTCNNVNDRECLCYKIFVMSLDWAFV